MAEGVELLNVGGNANNGSQCGLSYANSNNAFSDSRTNIGARLRFYFLLSNDRALETLQGQRKNGNGVSTFHMKKAKCEIYPLLSVMSL